MRKLDTLLVTGGCGFIGSAFVRGALTGSWFDGRIINLDLLTYAGNPKSVEGHVPQERYEFVRGDIADAELVLDLVDHHGVDAIVHFAAESHVDRSILGPDVFLQSNVVGTQRLLEAVRARPHVHFHHVSTDEVYGSLGPEGYFTEESPYAPNSPYSASKAASDHFVRAYAHTYGISVTVSNCSNNYGPFQFPEKLIPLMTLAMLENQPLPVYGDGGNVRDWLFVDDHVEALWAILEHGRAGATYNVGGSCERTNLQLVEALARTVASRTGGSAERLLSRVTLVQDRPGHDRRYAIDASKIQDELGWKPRHDIDGGLDATVRWYLENREWVEEVRSGEYQKWIATNYGERPPAVR
jgi:dTDP-glucose 4,6-dehydratase